MNRGGGGTDELAGIEELFLVWASVTVNLLLFATFVSREGGLNTLFFPEIRCGFMFSHQLPRVNQSDS